jgi:virginiamycin B lyase
MGSPLGADNVNLTITKYPATGPTGPIAPGPDDNVWFTDGVANAIGVVTQKGAILEIALPSLQSAPSGITGGADGNVWFTEAGMGPGTATGNKIGRVTPNGVVTEFAIPTADSLPIGIGLGPDGSVWFTEETSDKIGRITPAGTVTEFKVPTAGAGPSSIAAGPDGNVWFTESSGNKIGRATPSFASPRPTRTPPASWPGRTATSGSSNQAQVRSRASRRRGPSPSSR